MTSKAAHMTVSRNFSEKVATKNMECRNAVEVSVGDHKSTGGNNCTRVRHFHGNSPEDILNLTADVTN